MITNPELDRANTIVKEWNEYNLSTGEKMKIYDQSKRKRMKDCIIQIPYDEMRKFINNLDKETVERIELLERQVFMLENKIRIIQEQRQKEKKGVRK